MIEEAQVQARRIIADAEAEAAAIVSNAEFEAQQVREAAKSSAPSSLDTVHTLQGAIGSFDEVNHELLREITALRHALDADIEERHR